MRLTQGGCGLTRSLKSSFPPARRVIYFTARRTYSRPGTLPPWPGSQESHQYSSLMSNDGSHAPAREILSFLRLKFRQLTASLALDGLSWQGRTPAHLLRERRLRLSARLSRMQQVTVSAYRLSSRGSLARDVQAISTSESKYKNNFYLQSAKPTVWLLFVQFYIIMRIYYIVNCGHLKL